MPVNTKWIFALIVIASLGFIILYHDLLDLIANKVLDDSTVSTLVQSKGMARAGHFQMQIDTNTGFTGLDLKSAQQLFSRYCTTKTAVCPNMTRFGNKGPGGYNVCVTSHLITASNCIVYSFGINNNWSFDDDAKKYGCEVHSFDPSIHQEDHERAPGHYFHNLGLWDQDMTNTKGWKLATLGTILNQLGHSQKVLDVVKIDIEGAEWPFLQQFIKTEWPRQIRQLIFEIHTPTFAGTPMSLSNFQSMYNDFTTLRDKHHFHLYHYLHNGCCKYFDTLTPHGMVSPQKICCYELFYINLNNQIA